MRLDHDPHVVDGHGRHPPGGRRRRARAAAAALAATTAAAAPTASTRIPTDRARIRAAASNLISSCPPPPRGPSGPRGGFSTPGWTANHRPLTGDQQRLVPFGRLAERETGPRGTGTTTWSVAVLGPCQLTRSDGSDEVALSPLQARLLSRLALAAPRPVPLVDLFEAVWHEEPPATARAALQNQVSRLRAKAGDAVVETTAHGYRLGVGTDADTFVARLDEAEHPGGSDDLERCMEHFDAALALWRGDPYRGAPARGGCTWGAGAAGGAPTRPPRPTGWRRYSSRASTAGRWLRPSGSSRSTTRTNGAGRCSSSPLVRWGAGATHWVRPRGPIASCASGSASTGGGCCATPRPASSPGTRPSLAPSRPVLAVVKRTCGRSSSYSPRATRSSSRAKTAPARPPCSTRSRARHPSTPPWRWHGAPSSPTRQRPHWLSCSMSWV